MPINLIALYDERGRCVGGGGIMSVIYNDLSKGFKTTSLASKQEHHSLNEGTTKVKKLVGSSISEGNSPWLLLC